jgi:TolB-like protein
MLAGEVPFKGSTSRLIYQHQHATPPVDKLTHVPQPVIVLLEVLLEKDPDRRLQTPTELVQVIAKVTESLESGRRVTTDQLRLGVAGISLESKQSKRRFHPLLAGARMRAFGWLLASVLGIAVLLLAWFFFSGHSGLFSTQRVAEMVPPEKSIAILPFENISANKDDAYFADGVQDEILSNVARVSQLKVISRTSVMQYRADTKRDLRQIASALGVANILEGTVRRAANRVRITIELVDARTDQTIWSESYDRDLTDIFTIQSDVAQTVASKLTATLSPEEKKRIEAKPTDNLEAYELYLRAKELIATARVSYTDASFEKPLREAIGYLDQAIRLDPKFALAYCESALGHALLYRGFDPKPGQRTLADLAINRALSLQPELPEVRLAYATHLYVSYRDYEQARLQLDMAKRGLANNAEAFALEAAIDRRQGDWQNAIKNLREAITRDPRNAFPMTVFANALLETHQFLAAEKAYDRLIELLPSQKPMLNVEKTRITYLSTADDAAVRSAIAALPSSIADDRRVLFDRVEFALNRHDWLQANELLEKMKAMEDEDDLVGCYCILLARLQVEQFSHANSSFAEHREQLNQKVQTSPEDANILSRLALVDAWLNNKEAAVSEAKRAVGMLPISKDAVEGPYVAVNLAIVYAWTNELDLAFETLASLTKTPNGIYYGQLKLDPRWDPLRKDPRFDKLLAELAPKD